MGMAASNSEACGKNEGVEPELDGKWIDPSDVCFALSRDR